jgi:hypothetical protein
MCCPSVRPMCIMAASLPLTLFLEVKYVPSWSVLLPFIRPLYPDMHVIGFQAPGSKDLQRCTQNLATTWRKSLWHTSRSKWCCSPSIPFSLRISMSNRQLDNKPNRTLLICSWTETYRMTASTKSNGPSVGRYFRFAKPHVQLWNFRSAASFYGGK